MGLSFATKYRVYTYSKEMDNIDQGSTENTLGRRYVLENCLMMKYYYFKKQAKHNKKTKK